MASLVAKLQNPIAAPGNSVVNSMLNKISNFSSSIELIKNENLELERTRDQYHIHLMQCLQDYDTLCSLYKSLKQKLDRAMSEKQTQNAPNTQQTGSTIQQEMGIVPNFSVNTKNVKLTAAYKVGNYICSVTYNKAGTLVAFVAGYILYILNAQNGQCVAEINLPTETEPNDTLLRAIAFSPDDKYIAFTGFHKQIYIVSVADKSVVTTFVGHDAAVSSILFTPTGEFLLSGGFDGNVIFWDMKALQMHRKIPIKINQTSENIIVGIATSPDHSFYAVATSDGYVSIFQPDFSEMGVSFLANKGLIGIAVSPLDDFIATVSSDNTIKVWSVRMFQNLKQELTGHKDTTLSATFSAQEQVLISGSKDRSIRMWNYKTGEVLAVINAHSNTVFAVAHHPEKKQFVSVGGDFMICFWDYSDQ